MTTEPRDEADPANIIKRELWARLDEVMTPVGSMHQTEIGATTLGDWLGDRVFAALLEAGTLLPGGEARAAEMRIAAAEQERDKETEELHLLRRAFAAQVHETRAAESRGWQRAVAALRDRRGFESWCADTGRYEATAIDYADWLESIAATQTPGDQT